MIRIDNKLSIRFGEYKTKSVLLSSDNNSTQVEQLDIEYKWIEIQQHKNVNYLGYMLDKTTS